MIASDDVNIYWPNSKNTYLREIAPTNVVESPQQETPNTHEDIIAEIPKEKAD